MKSGISVHKQESHKMESRKWSLTVGLLCVVFSFFCAGMLGALFAVLLLKDQNFTEAFIYFSQMMYFLFTASITIGGILMILFPTLEHHSISFGAGLYYGTIFVSSILADYIPDPPINRILISSTIVALVCYVVWLKHFKQSELEDTLRKYQRENERMQEALKDKNNATYILEMIARKAGATTTDLAESLYINFCKAGGLSDEAARAELQKVKQNWPQSK